MLVMRFARVGRKNKPQFRIVVQEHTAAPKGKHVEIIGSWDPSQKKGIFKNERIQYWLSQGVTASDSVHNLLISQEVIKGEKRKIKIAKKAVEPADAEAKSETAGAPEGEAPKTEIAENVTEAPAAEEKTVLADSEAKADKEVVEEAPKEAEGENK